MDNLKSFFFDGGAETASGSEDMLIKALCRVWHRFRYLYRGPGAYPGRLRDHDGQRNAGTARRLQDHEHVQENPRKIDRT
jgi:hypothetical protein